LNGNKTGDKLDKPGTDRPLLINNSIVSNGSTIIASDIQDSVVINSTIGGAGFSDPAKKYFNLDIQDEDFGQTLGHWGVGNGPYLVLPVIGPSTLRDSVGILVDNYNFDPIYQINHVSTRNSLVLVEALDKRADLLGASRVLEKAALDRYDFLKESYLQKREYEINNGDLSFPE